jgi:hypothetical protein
MRDEMKNSGRFARAVSGHVPAWRFPIAAMVAAHLATSSPYGFLLINEMKQHHVLTSIPSVYKYIRCFGFVK